MEQLSIDQLIKQTFINEYKDLHVYRWANRNKSWLVPLYLIVFIATAAIAPFNAWPLFGWACAFIGLIWIVSIDHFYIGTRLRKMQTILSKHGIIVNYKYILYICDDILPE